jgi:beta-N-acetylhexosaminidase
VKIDPAQARAQVGTAEHLAVAQKIADDSITLIRDTAKTIPIKSTTSTLVIDIATEDPTPAPIYSALKNTLSQVRSVVWDPTPTAEQVNQAVNLANGVDLVIVASYNAHLSPARAAATNRVLSVSKASVLVAIRNPYDAATISSAATALATYNSQQVSIASLAKVLLGQIPARGKLPVTVK